MMRILRNVFEILKAIIYLPAFVLRCYTIARNYEKRAKEEEGRCPPGGIYLRITERLHLGFSPYTLWLKIYKPEGDSRRVYILPKRGQMSYNKYINRKVS